MKDSGNIPDATHDRQIGFAILRLMLGINMLMRSVIRAPEMDGFASGMADGFADTFLPGGFVYLYAFVIVAVEAVVGVMLILGLRTRIALAVMGLLLCSLAFGVILQGNLGTAANILIYGIAVFLLLFNTRYDHYGIDRGFKRS